MTFILIFLFASQIVAQNNQNNSYDDYVYSQKDGNDLKAYVFSPDNRESEKSRPVIVFFHGGSWITGEPSWCFGLAQHFSERGMVGVAVQYRLSDQKDITPVDAMSDAQEAIKWLRLHKDTLHIDPKKIAAYGISAGGHLAVMAAINGDEMSAPNALVLVSPAVSLVDVEWSEWFKGLLLDRAKIDSLSPDKNVRKGLPPTIILQGRTDKITPLDGAQIFTNKMIAAGNRCDLIVYDNVGHLFTPSIENDRAPNPDPKVEAEALAEADEFLKSLRYIY